MSMLVNSLIDRFEQGPGRSLAPPLAPAPASLAPPLALLALLAPPPKIDDPGLMKLLGVESFPLGEDAYIETIRLRQEIERRKQEELRSQLADKNLEIIRMAMAAHIPPYLIPVMCVNPDEYHRTFLQLALAPAPGTSGAHSASTSGASGATPSATSAASASPHPTMVPPPMMPMTHPQAPAPAAPAYARFAPPALPTKRLAAAMYHHDHLNVNPTLPIHYKFGDGRPQSPAKRGAPAITVRAPMTPQQHQRPRRPLGAFHNRTILVPDNPELRLPLITKTLQVKPLPAQPPAKNRPPPTQELMTLFQHIIQFHHWKPGDKLPPTNTKSPAPGTSAVAAASVGRAPSAASAVSATSGTSAASAAPATRSPSDNSTAPASPDTQENSPQENSPQHINPHAPAALLTPREPSHKRYKLEVVRDSDDETIDDTTEMSPQQAPPAKFPHDIMS